MRSSREPSRQPSGMERTSVLHTHTHTQRRNSHTHTHSFLRKEEPAGTFKYTLSMSHVLNFSIFFLSVLF